MFEKKKKLELNNEELRILRYSLIDFRNNLLKQNKYVDVVDEVLVKLKNKMKKDKKLKIISFFFGLIGFISSVITIVNFVGLK